MNLLKKQIAACLKVEELTNALKEIVKVKGQGCNAKSGRDDIHWLAITNFTIIVAHILQLAIANFNFFIFFRDYRCVQKKQRSHVAVLRNT